MGMPRPERALLRPRGSLDAAVNDTDSRLGAESPWNSKTDPEYYLLVVVSRLTERAGVMTVASEY